MNSRLFWQLLDQAQDIHGSALAVLLVLAGLADRGGDCWPWPRTIAHRAHISRAQAYRILNDLVEAGYVERRRPQAAGFPPTLHVCLPPSHTDDTPSHVDNSPSPTDDNVLYADDSSVSSSGTNHARSLINPLINHKKLTPKSPGQGQGRICAYKGCDKPANGVLCDLHRKRGT